MATSRALSLLQRVGNHMLLQLLLLLLARGIQESFLGYKKHF